MGQTKSGESRPSSDKSRRRLIAINRFYRPDHSATSQLLTDLLQSLVPSGYDVAVVTSRQAYDARARHPSKETLDGVKVVRVWTSNFGRSNLLARAVDYVTFYFTSTIALFKIVQRGDILLAKTDPPLISVTAGLVCRLKGARLVNWCQDLFPETAAALGLGWAKGAIGMFAKAMRNRSMKKATVNVAIHRRMAAHIEEQGIPSSRIVTIENWADRNIRPIDRDINPTRRDWGFGDEIVIGYSGNLGRAHMPELVAELVNSSITIPGITWLFIGGGAGTARLKELVDPSVPLTFRSYQPIEKLSESLSAPDIHLVSLDPACEGLIHPSKYYGALSVLRPVLFLGAKDGAMASDIRESKFGASLDCSAPDSWNKILTNFVDEVRNGPIEKAHVPQISYATQRDAWQTLLGSLAGSEQGGRQSRDRQ